MIAAMIPLVFTSLLVTVSTFHINQKFRPLSRNVFPLFDSEINNERVDGYDPGEFEQIFKVLNPEINNKNKTNKIDNGIVSESEDGSTKEELFRKYPFENLELPILTDCNNYYSGKYEDSFWLQNSDQVFVYIPIVDDIPARDISVKFEVKRVDIKIKGEAKTVFCSERIIPDGSFWTMETDKNGVRYLQLDLEKRFRMINWKNVFSEQSIESDEDLEARRNEMLQRLLSANKGVSKLSGTNENENSIESINEMMQNEMLMKMINSEVNTTPQIIGATQDGEEVVDFSNNAFVRAVQQRINDQEFEGVQSIPRDNDGKFIDTSFTESNDTKK